MAEGALTIRNTEVLFSTVLGFLSDENILKNGVTISKPLKKITIHFTGSAYKSSMPTRTMRSFIELQDAIYSIYSMYAYGDKKRLPAEIRHDLELDVIVREGSSWYDVPLEKIVSAVSERIKAMTGKELAGVTA
ncbi:MAG: hypothetical protein LBK83_11155, partial [Treponema sp.]|nr:hypothetical protein [Treponema sp.]